ncbi:MAG: thiamine diphosphokinase [Lactobacillales bacterium]|jgi:thiamine pyrophosphokinase|nr:thiamine diphosphokinase [Lactobacillales bacterium]
MKNIVIVAGGDVHLAEQLKPFQQADTFFIGVDRGGLRLMQGGFPLNYAVGDYDSMNEEEFQQVKSYAKKLYRTIPEKDDTDMQLGLLYAVENYPKAQYWVFGATGGRLDHFLSNLYLPLDERFESVASQIHLLDEQNEITYYHPGKYTITREKQMTYLAYVCLTAVKGLELVGAKYNLPKTDFARPISLSSNEFITDTAKFSFETGLVAVIQSKDKQKTS